MLAKLQAFYEKYGPDYVKEVLAGEHDPYGNHISALPVYYAIYGALLILTVLTVAVSYADLGPLSLPVAMLVAIIKASLVVGYFMHLKYDTPFNVLVFFGSLVFLAIFFVFVMVDLNSRGTLAAEQENFSIHRAQDPAEVKPAFVTPKNSDHGGGAHGDKKDGH